MSYLNKRIKNWSYTKGFGFAFGVKCDLDMRCTIRVKSTVTERDLSETGGTWITCNRFLL